MKRTIEVTTKSDRGEIRISATIDTKGYPLTRDETEAVRDQLADDLMQAAHRVRYMNVPLNRVRVR